MQLSSSVQQKFKSHDCQTRMFTDTDEQNDVGKKIYKETVHWQKDNLRPHIFK